MTPEVLKTPIRILDEYGFERVPYETRAIYKHECGTTVRLSHSGTWWWAEFSGPEWEPRTFKYTRGQLHQFEIDVQNSLPLEEW